MSTLSRCTLATREASKVTANGGGVHAPPVEGGVRKLGLDKLCLSVGHIEKQDVFACASVCTILRAATSQKGSKDDDAAVGARLPFFDVLWKGQVPSRLTTGSLAVS